MYCADIGGSFIKFGRPGAPGEMHRHGQVPTPTGDWDALLAALRHFTRADDTGQPLSLSLAGLVDPDSGVVTCANIPCLGGRPLARQLEAALRRPVRVANDADCLVLAEARLGAARGQRVVFGVILGTGVGGGLVVGGRLVQGAGGITGEWGHAPIATARLRDGTPVPRFACGCGQAGCADSFGSARGLERLHAALGHGAADSRAIVDGWGRGDARACRTIGAWLEMLSEPLALAVNLTGAAVVPVGGGLGTAPALVAALDVAVRARILRRMDTPLLVPAMFPETGGLLGAAMLEA